VTFRRPSRSEQRRSTVDAEPRVQGDPATRDFDAEIARTDAEAETLRVHMSDALTAWLDATAQWAAAFWEGAIAETVHDQPGAVVALGGDVRTAVKEEATQLIANARPHVQRRLVDDRNEDWPHLKPQTDSHDPAFRGEGASGPFDIGEARGQASAPEVVAGRLNGVLGDIASVFAHHGFSLKGFEHGDPFGHKGRWHPNREHRPQWSAGMAEAMAAYAELHRRYVAVLAEREELRREQQRSVASQLWSSA
jgi:hypothetical protein